MQAIRIETDGQLKLMCDGRANDRAAIKGTDQVLWLLNVNLNQCESESM